MKIHRKFIINIILAVLLLYLFTPSTFAAREAQQSEGGGSVGGGSGTLGGIVSDADDFLKDGTSQESPINDETLKSGSSTLYNVLLVIGVGVAFIWGIVIGIQFITGTLGEKADMKKALVPYAIGCIIIFGAFGIWKLVINLLQPLA